MDTLRERLADLADNAPTGGVPAAELWARGTRAYRLRVAGLAAALLVVGVVGTGIGLHLADGDGSRSDLEPAGTVGISLPIQYPVGEELPDLGLAPGPLAAIWVDRVDHGAPEVVGVVAETGTFGTLPIDLVGNHAQYTAADPRVALSPDGRMIAYSSPTPNDSETTWASGELIVRDLVNGRAYPALSPESGIRGSADQWIDATHLVGHAVTRPPAGWADNYGWIWEPGKALKLIDLMAVPGQPYLGYGWPYGGTNLSILPHTDESSCPTPWVAETLDDRNRGPFEVPVLCDVVGVVGTEILLGHEESDDPEGGSGTVVALDIHGADLPYLDPALRGPGADHAFDNPARRQAVVTAGAPHRVTFATDLIGEALDVEGGAS